MGALELVDRSGGAGGLLVLVEGLAQSEHKLEGRTLPGGEREGLVAGLAALACGNCGLGSPGAALWCRAVVGVVLRTAGLGPLAI